MTIFQTVKPFSNFITTNIATNDTKSFLQADTK